MLEQLAQTDKDIQTLKQDIGQLTFYNQRQELCAEELTRRQDDKIAAVEKASEGMEAELASVAQSVQKVYVMQ